MNIKNTTSTLLIAAAISIAPFTQANSNASLNLEFENREAYRDIETSYGNFDTENNPVLATIEQDFRRVASKYLPNNWELDVRVMQIDLAGDQSTLSSAYGDFRVDRDVFAPVLHFGYTVKDSQERVVASGTAKKSEPFYTQLKISPRNRSNEYTPYLSDMIDRWASTELRRITRAN